MSTLGEGCFLIACALLGAATEKEVSYSRDVRPILADRCFKCHGPSERMSNLRLDLHSGATAEADSGSRAIVPGDADASELMRRVSSQDVQERMPPEDANVPRLTEAEIGVLRRWIDAGAEYEPHWAYVAPERAESPKVDRTRYRVNGEIDAFVAARLEREGLEQSDEADRSTLIRRLSLDLTGLPPTPEQVAAFVADDSRDAYEKLVDRLLSSPRYGEQWARMWLDLARYGDSAGYQHDMEMPLWPYRDWVIQALNADMPFDRFSVAQIAGDLLPNATLDDRVATGFQRCATVTLGADNDAEELRAQLMWDRVNTFGTTWLAASFECAQCHDHKFDPITQRDYYRLYAYFNRATPELTHYASDHFYITGGILELPVARERIDRARRLNAAIVDEFNALESALAAGRDGRDVATPPTIHRLLVTPREEREADRIAYLFLDELKPSQKAPRAAEPFVSTIRRLSREYDLVRPPRTLVLEESETPVTSHVLLRGDVKTPGEVVTPGTPTMLHASPEGARGDRLGLAEWLMRRDNPLTARVMVNRLWAEHFGRGLVATTEDFGFQGDWPSHPELLDWLAVEFMESGWSLKHIQRLIVTSATYRRSSRVDAGGRVRDPLNVFLARGPRLRLDAETLRDNALAISGLLDLKQGGRPVAATREAAEAELPFTYRRSVYVRRQRGAPYGTFTTFDAPDGFACVARRARSNTPLQALALLNEPLFVEAARGLAHRAMREAENDTTEAILGRMFELCVSRRPSAAEITELASLHAAKLRRGGSPAEAAFLCANVLLNLDETMSRE